LLPQFSHSEGFAQTKILYPREVFQDLRENGVYKLYFSKASLTTSIRPENVCKGMPITIWSFSSVITY
jgi:hypothetical protein